MKCKNCGGKMTKTKDGYYCPIVGLAASVLYSGMKYLFAILCVALMGCATTQTTDPTATKGGPSGDWSRHGLTH
jgi:hypothetical protein